MHNVRSACLYFLGLFLLAWMIVAVPASASETPASTVPAAVYGCLDLSEWDFSGKGIISLSGQWEFYWNDLLEPQDFTGDTPVISPGYLHAPALWNSYQSGQARIGPFGYGTYRLQVKLKPGTYGLNINDFSSCYRLFINGEPVAESGQVGKTAESTIPQWLPKISTVTIAHSPAEVIVQVANFSHIKGGMWEPIQIGTPEQVFKRRDLAIGIKLFLLGSMLIMGMYHLCLFVMRKKEFPALYLGLFCLDIFLRTFVTGEVILTNLFPNFNFELHAKLEYLTFPLGVISYVAFLYHLYPRHWSRTIYKMIIVISLVYTLTIISFPLRIFACFFNPYALIFMFFLVYLFLSIGRAYRAREQGARLILLGTIILAVPLLNDIAYANRLHNIYVLANTVPFGLLIMVFLQTIVLARKFTNALTKEEVLSKELLELNETLEQKVKSRTIDLALLNSQLQELNLQLENMESSRRNLMANISHDLRTPITLIQGYLDAILEGVVTNSEQQRKYLLRAQAGTENLTYLTDQLFELAQLESGQLKPLLQEVSVKQLLNEIYENYELDLSASNRLFKLSLPDLTIHPTVLIDSELFGRVFANLIHNATKYTTPGQSIEIGCYLESDQVIFSVADTGTGISPQDLPRIFERFYMGSKARRGSTGSGGLGLAIVQEIIQLLKGRIWVQSETGRGTTIYFALPVINS